MNTKSTNEDHELIQSVIEILRQGETLLAEISDESYTLKVPLAFNATIGGHYRHCLDHFRTLFESATTGDLNYDHRERGTLVENDRFAALNATRELREAYEKLEVVFIPRLLQVTCKTSYSTGGSQVALSTVGREIMYGGDDTEAHLVTNKIRRGSHLFCKLFGRDQSIVHQLLCSNLDGACGKSLVIPQQARPHGPCLWRLASVLPSIFLSFSVFIQRFSFQP